MKHPKPRFQTLNETILDDIEKLSREEQAQWLILSPSDEFKGRWYIESIYPDWFLDFEEIVGPYRTVSPANLDKFLSHAESGGYHVIFDQPPEIMLDSYDRLKDPPPFCINSTLDNTVNGFFPWQIQGFNKLIRDESINAGLVIHDTGTGKTTFIAAALKWHQQFGHPNNIALIVVKKNNKSDMQVKLKQLADIDSFIIRGNPKQRDRIYEQIDEHMATGQSANVILNYEQFRGDGDILEALVEDRNLLVFFDEMPTRLSNRSTAVYKAVKKCLWSKFSPSKGSQSRAKWMRSWALTATPIENSPEGLFNYIRLMAPSMLGLVEEFHSEYVSHYNIISHKPERWKNLDRLEGRIEHMTHRVSKKDPEISSMFPNLMEDVILIDWDPKDRIIYDKLTGKAVQLIEEENMFEEENVLSLIQILQMMCDAPSMVVHSAENRELWENLAQYDSSLLPKGSDIAVKLLQVLPKPPIDDHHTKFDTLREIITEKHPNDKLLIYMTWGDYGYAPLEKKLKEWDISYVAYNGTENDKNTAKKRFRDLCGPQVFLSSDKGSDSIDLPEAVAGINYNLPWTWTRKRQRQGRNDRVNSRLDTIWWYDLIMTDSVELRKKEILSKKQNYHDVLFNKNAVDNTLSSKLTREDLLFILSGEPIES